MTLQTLLEDNDFNARSYSGRGMNGKTCLAVSLGSDFAGDLLLIGSLIADHNTDNPTEVIDIPTETRTDSMGRGIVVYWPEIQFLADDEEDDEDFDDE
jgi:hypothetical protein